MEEKNSSENKALKPAEGGSTPVSVKEENAMLVNPYASIATYKAAWNMAVQLSRSSLVPEPYRGTANIPNCMVALEMAGRVGIGPFMVMQNLNVIHGRPSWASTYLIGTINTCGRFTPLRYRMTDEGMITVNGKQVKNTSCVAWAKDIESGDILEGEAVSVDMAVKEGWYGRNGSKWPNMPGQMLRYRAASFFCRAHCPEISLGLRTIDENEDIYETDGDVQIPKKSAEVKAKDLTEKITEEENVTEAQLHPAETKTQASRRPAKKEEPQTSHTTASAAAGQTSMDSGGDPDPSKFDIPPAAQAAAADTNAVEDGELF